MADTLEDFLTKIRRDLAALPTDERERRLDSVSEELARFIAVRLDQGLDEETATAEAIQEFDSAYQVTLDARGTSTNRFSGNLSPIFVAALYCAVANKAVALLIGSFIQLISGWSLPSFTSLRVSLFVSPDPSLLLAFLAAAVLVRREGFSKIAATLSSSKTLEGNGARWTALNQGFLFLLSLAIILLFRDDFPVAAGIATVLLLFMLAAPFASGWIVARAVPKAGLCGVQIAAVTGALLSFTDQCTWLFDFDNGVTFVFRVLLFLLVLLGQALLVALAVLGAYLGSHDTPRRR
ncbi:MAG: hypothetical protein V4671_17720 [Armatimonadota bacterium]